MTYQEFVASKERLAKLEKEYMDTWTQYAILKRKLERLSAQMQEIDNAIENCKHYK